MCSCGCNTCETKAPLLTEGVLFKQPISENLLYHIKNAKPLTENTFRYGSTAFIELWKEARTLYSRNILDVGADDEQILLETHLGEYGMFEGERVPLDLPMVEEEEEELNIGDVVEINPKEFPSFEFPYGTKGTIENIDKADYASDDLVYTVKIKYIDGQGDEANTLHIENSYQYLDEAKKKVEKHPPLNKPHRGGSKKFYVYVKDPKTKRIKKVSFGDTTGLKAKINNPKARKAFAERHDCKNKKDKTKAGYWSCRLPRYASLLGLKGSYSGYW